MRISCMHRRYLSHGTMRNELYGSSKRLHFKPSHDHRNLWSGSQRTLRVHVRNVRNPHNVHVRTPVFLKDFRNLENDSLEVSNLARSSNITLLPLTNNLKHV